MTASPRYRRIVLKVSGESLSSAHTQLDHVRVGEVARTLRELRDMEITVTVVVGGGNIFRGNLAGEWELDRDTADEIGMTATALNAQLLAGTLRSRGTPHQIFSRGTASGVGIPYNPLRMREMLRDGMVAIVAGGSGEPGHSTDLPAVQAAADTDAEVVIMAKHGTDGVYDADPRGAPEGCRPRFLAELTASDALDWGLGVMDAAALALARDNGTSIHVVGAGDPGNVTYAVQGKEIGSVIHPR